MVEYLKKMSCLLINIVVTISHKTVGHKRHMPHVMAEAYN